MLEDNIHLHLVVDRTEVDHIAVDHIAVDHIGAVRIAVVRIAEVGGNHLVVGRIRFLRLWPLAL